MSARQIQVASVLVGFALAGCQLEPQTPTAPARTPEIEAGGLARAQQEIADREYRASENGQGLQAPNRAHNLRTYFEKTGIRVHDRTAGGSPELVSLTLAGVGRGDALAAVAAGDEVVTNENRVEIRREGLVEWYVNSEAGLEQGFTVSERPAGQGALVLELALAGARPALRGDAILFETAAGRKLRYGELAVNDAARRPLAARFELAGAERLRIVVDDAEAEYPVAIDPLLTETADSQLESDLGSAGLGSSVASAGDVNGDGYADLIVGAPNAAGGNGAAYIFLGGPTGVPSGGPSGAAAVLTSTGFISSFGQSVASAGDVNGDGYADVIVGAYGYDAGQGFFEGAAFVFLGGPSGIASGNESTAAARLESDQAGANLGLSVGSAGDVNGDGYDDVIVGASSYDNGEMNEGAAFVFLGGASGIANGNPATAAAVLESNQADAHLGSSVASAGDVNGDGHPDVIVGASNYDNGQANEGAAFIFLGSVAGIASGNPATAATWLESNQTSGGGGNAPALGASVASAGDVNGDGYADVIVGAPYYDQGDLDEGAAFLFHGGPSGVANGNPSTAATLIESNQNQSFLGGSVAGAGDVNGDGYSDVIAGAPYYNDGQFDEGVAFVFTGGPSGVASGLPSAAAARLESDQAFAVFGASVGSADDVNGDGYADVIVGAPDFSNGEPGEGAAFVYHGGGTGIADGNPATADSVLESNQAGGGLGNSVASAGDVNGDGYADVIVGASLYDAGQTNEGAAFVFLGDPLGVADGDPSTAAVQLESDQAGALFGHIVAGAGDVNGDGYADVIVGAPGYDAGETDECVAFVFLGGPNGIASGDPSTANARVEANQTNACGPVGFLGLYFESVAGAGDVNGDGYADVIVGAPLYDAGEGFAEGAAFVFLGGPSGIADGNPATAHAVLESNQMGGGLGLAVASAGDVNGDGFADVIVGAPEYSNGQLREGAAFVFLGSASGIPSGNPATAATLLESNQTSPMAGPPVEFGWSVASAGDVNGDGYADVIVGAPDYYSGLGWAFVFHGSPSGVANGNPATAATYLLSVPRFGAGVAGAGDVNGDGYADVIVGSPHDGVSDEGAAFVFLGGPSGIADESSAGARLESNQATARFGASVASAGDVNGDGYADVIVGAPAYDNGETDEGAAFVFLGNDGGRPVLARQRRGDGSGIPVEPWGGSSSPAGFALELTATHPDGSGRVKAEFEACPPAVAFGDASCSAALTPSWVLVNGAAPEALLSHTFTTLANETLYRWRARVLYAPATGPIPAEPFHGPWRRPTAQSVEADVRVIPEPGLVLSLASGAALLAALSRRRKDVARATGGAGRQAVLQQTSS